MAGARLSHVPYEDSGSYSPSWSRVLIGRRHSGDSTLAGFSVTETFLAASSGNGKHRKFGVDMPLRLCS